MRVCVCVCVCVCISLCLCVCVRARQLGLTFPLSCSGDLYTAPGSPSWGRYNMSPRISVNRSARACCRHTDTRAHTQGSILTRMRFDGAHLLPLSAQPCASTSLSIRHGGVQPNMRVHTHTHTHTHRHTHTHTPGFHCPCGPPVYTQTHTSTPLIVALHPAFLCCARLPQLCVCTFLCACQVARLSMDTHHCDNDWVGRGCEGVLFDSF